MATTRNSVSFVDEIRLSNSTQTIDVPVISFDSSNRLRIGNDAVTTMIDGAALTIDLSALLFPDGTAAAPAISFASDTNTGFHRVAADTLSLSLGGTSRLGFGSNNLTLASTISLGFSSTDDGTGTPDAILVRASAGVIAQKNGTNAQEFEVWGTTTGSKYIALIHNGTDGFLNTSSGALKLNAAAGSTISLNSGGADMDIVIQSDTNANHFVSDAGAFSGVGAFGFGQVVTGDTYFQVNPPAFSGAANTSVFKGYFGSATAVTVPAGTAPVVATLRVDEPNITATGTVSDAYSLYVSGAPTEGTRNGSLWVASGISRFDATVKIGGTAARATTAGTNLLDIFDGTAPVGTLANGCSLYSTSGELRVMDAAGNATLLSPHDKTTNEWIYFSKNTVTGQVLRIDIERLLKRLDQQFGGGFIREYVEDPTQ